MSIKKSRKNHAKLQYNTKLQLIIRVQHNLNQGNRWRIDGNLGGSSSTFQIWRHRTFIKAIWLQFDKVMCKPSFPLKIIVILQLANSHSLQYSE